MVKKLSTLRYKASLCLTQVIPCNPCTSLCHYQHILPYEIVHNFEEEGIGYPVTWHCVHLGNQKLCIVVGKMQGITCGCVFLITLEYELITNSKSSSLDIQYRWLSTRHFGYVGPENVRYLQLLTALVLWLCKFCWFLTSLMIHFI